MTDEVGGVAGRLLVAAPSLVDPNFRQSVVLLLEHGEDGALGIVLNSPTEVDVVEALDGWRHLVADPPVVFRGGPVTPNGVIGLGRGVPGEPDPALRPVVGRVGVVDLDKDPHDVRLEAMRLFAGHAGWAPGQLDEEIEGGSWFIVDPHPDDVVTRDPEQLWRGVLVRQGGVYATFPDDPSLN